LREFVSATVAVHGYDVVAAKDGLDVLDQLAEPLPDVMISDLKMPRMSGLELLAVVRQRFQIFPRLRPAGSFGEASCRTRYWPNAYSEKG
jgi:CheY-like chemotaxis protein